MAISVHLCTKGHNCTNGQQCTNGHLCTNSHHCTNANHCANGNKCFLRTKNAASLPRMTALALRAVILRLGAVVLLDDLAQPPSSKEPHCLG